MTSPKKNDIAAPTHIKHGSRLVNRLALRRSSRGRHSLSASSKATNSAWRRKRLSRRSEAVPVPMIRLSRTTTAAIGNSPSSRASVASAKASLMYRSGNDAASVIRLRRNKDAFRTSRVRGADSAPHDRFDSSAVEESRAHSTVD